MKGFVLWAVRWYQRIGSPYLGGRCRYDPSCSHYALEAIERHGLTKGFLLTLWRLVRCAPWGGYGYDPVPPVGAWRFRPPPYPADEGQTP
ncbi:MAG: membrane protein insertion efficiency factor YidD [Dehalococcoidia bacterium]|nr:membrane protein insertion efficiency factor YidD [Dehalococcoidia bacterium]MDW8119867.1 membrane protein insertion efficiency factor YidD [Chloroflexota bacterium]